MTAGPRDTPSSPRVRSNLQLRVISAIVLGALAIAATWAGGFWFQLFCALIGALVFYEWAAMTRAICDRRAQVLAAIALAVALLALVIETPYLSFIVAGAVAVMLVATLFDREAWIVAGGIYALVAALPLALLRGHEFAGLAAVLVLYALVWGTDTFAYFVGRSLGGPKLAPAISPGKTWSGSVGGAVGGTLAALFVGYLCGVAIDVRLVLVLLIVSVISQMGDLFESWVKRRRGVKDSSHLIPGHGGVMDRVDGLIVAALAFWLIGGLVGEFDAPARWLFPV
ncbi:phosphatidate cytidylyltransferase [Mesorhizobium sp. RP14(2022)]|uniref:Phosphatidate cytidylyltransferase n=1 Tax=Mesorhizobium liriopis TaxID=2953882 RepID=A0ABT1C6V7_9HYPH|nr:phosphatidate cytidylyltransferase [Mesorhizobium liriopis]